MKYLVSLTALMCLVACAEQSVTITETSQGAVAQDELEAQLAEAQAQVNSLNRALMIAIGENERMRLSLHVCHPNHGGHHER